MEDLKAIVNDPHHRTTAFLLKNGVPFDVAESWPEETRSAYFIIFHELAGQEFDWDKMDWARP